MVQLQKLTPGTLLAAPRRGAAIPNRNGQLALHTVSTHQWGDKTIGEVRVMDLQTCQSSVISSDDKVHDSLWLPGADDDIVYIKSADKGISLVYIASATDLQKEHYLAAEINAPVANLKLKQLDDGVAFVVTGLVGDDGELYNEEVVEKKSTGLVYDTVNVRIVSVTSLQVPSSPNMLN